MNCVIEKIDARHFSVLFLSVILWEVWSLHEEKAVSPTVRRLLVITLCCFGILFSFYYRVVSIMSNRILGIQRRMRLRGDTYERQTLITEYIS